MPVASSSRRKVLSRKQLSTDHIEDDIVSDAVDNVEEEDLSKRRLAKTIKKEQKSTVTKGKGKARGRRVVEEEGDENDRMGFEDIGDQPLMKGDAAKLRGLATDWSQIRKGVHQPSFQQLRDIAITIADTAHGEESKKWIDELDNIMRELIDIDEEMIAHEKVVDEVYQELVQGKQISDALDRYDSGLEKKVTDYQKKTSRQRYAKHEAYIAFRQGIHEALYPEEPMPPITGTIPKEEGDGSDDDDDLEVGGMTQDYKCPITLTTLVDPMTAPCGHSFSKEAIITFFRDSRSKKCPGAGCSRTFTLADLKEDKDLAKKIKLAKRRAQRSDDESDADEVVDSD